MVSLLMVSYRRPALLAKTIATIGNVDELIIIEDIRPHRDNEFLNPAPLWNKALDMASGDVLIIQNPECLHVNNVVENLSKVPRGEAWFASCESLTKDGHFDMWYTHPKHRRMPYFFCGSINRDDMVRWDEELTGEGYEDDALARCLQDKGIKFKWLNPLDVYVQHQWHTRGIAESNASLFIGKYGQEI